MRYHLYTIKLSKKQNQRNLVSWLFMSSNFGTEFRVIPLLKSQCPGFKNWWLSKNKLCFLKNESQTMKRWCSLRKAKAVDSETGSRLAFRQTGEGEMLMPLDFHLHCWRVVVGVSMRKSLGRSLRWSGAARIASLHSTHPLRNRAAAKGSVRFPCKRIRPDSWELPRGHSS